MLILLLIIPVIFFLALEGFFSGSETAIISANKMRLRVLADRGDSRAKLASQLLSRPERLLGTTLVGTNMAMSAGTTLASVVVAFLLMRVFGVERPDLETSVNTIVMAPLILIFAEIIPKSICRARANPIALAISPALRWASVVLYPIVASITKISSSIALVFSRRSRHRQATVVEELRLLARLSEKEGLLRPQQRKMIHSVFDLEQQTVERVMVPLVDVVSVEKDISQEELYDKAVETGYSRFPVYEDRIDNVIGIMNVLDALYSIDDIPIVHEDIVYLPESKHITTSLHELQRSHYPMAVVVDEYGGVVGIVTKEDLVEEIIGDIRDERDQAKDGFDESTLECEGRMEIDEINEHLGTDIPKEGYETIAGFVIKQMDRIPEVGEETSWDNLRIEVIEANKRGVSRVRFTIEERNEDGEETETGDTEG
ncbi:hemolysin family protein [Candidatus Poribacteria bacterium]